MLDKSLLKLKILTMEQISPEAEAAADRRPNHSADQCVCVSDAVCVCVCSPLLWLRAR